MKLLAGICAAAMLASGSMAAQAQENTAEKPAVEVVERNDDGDVTKVSIDGRVYDVCMSTEQDSCINPRDAGLNFGNWELSYWPGEPASNIEGPIPVDPPVEDAAVEEEVEVASAPPQA